MGSGAGHRRPAVRITAFATMGRVRGVGGPAAAGPRGAFPPLRRRTRASAPRTRGIGMSASSSRHLLAQARRAAAPGRPADGSMRRVWCTAPNLSSWVGRRGMDPGPRSAHAVPGPGCTDALVETSVGDVAGASRDARVRSASGPTTSSKVHASSNAHPSSIRRAPAWRRCSREFVARAVSFRRVDSPSCAVTRASAPRAVACASNRAQSARRRTARPCSDTTPVVLDALLRR